MSILQRPTATTSPLAMSSDRNRWNVWYYRHRWVLWGICSFAVIVGVGWMALLRPLMAQVKSERDDINATQETLLGLETQVAQMERLISEYQTLATKRPEDIEHVFEALPTTARQAEWFGSVEGLVGTHGGVLEKIAVDHNKTGAPASQRSQSRNAGSALDTTERLSGLEIMKGAVDIALPPDSYDAFKNLLNGFEASTRFIDITNIQYAQSGTQVGGLPLTLQTYYLPDE